MTEKLATVKSHETNGGAGGRSTAASIRLGLAQAWGEMGAAWGVTPAFKSSAVSGAEPDKASPRNCASSTRSGSPKPTVFDSPEHAELVGAGVEVPPDGTVVEI